MELHQTVVKVEDLAGSIGSYCLTNASTMIRKLTFQHFQNFNYFIIVKVNQ